MNFYKTLFLLITILLPVITTSATTLNFDKQVVIDLRLPYQAEWMNTDVFSISANGAKAIKRGKQYFASKPEGSEYILGMDFMSSDVETSLVGLIVGSDESGIIIAHLKSHGKHVLLRRHEERPATKRALPCNESFSALK